MKNRLAALGQVRPSPGGPAYEELGEAEEKATEDRPVQAAAFMHGVECQVMVRAPHVYELIQVYCEQYLVARGFIIPLAVQAVILPFWAPIAILDGVGSIGPFPIIRSQVFMVSTLASAVCFVAFRERAYRYSAAKAQAWVTIEGIDAKKRGDD